MRSIVLMKCTGLLLIGAFIISHTAEARELKIVISGIAFSPQTIHAHVGDRIRWINNDGVRHEIYFARNPTLSKAPYLRYQLRPNQSVSITVTKHGEYDYICRWHGMLGSIRIR